MLKHNRSVQMSVNSTLAKFILLDAKKRVWMYCMSYSNTLKLCNAKTIAKKMTIYKVGIRQEALAELVNPQRENFPVSIYPPLLAIPPLPDKNKKTVCRKTVNN